MFTMFMTFGGIHSRMFFYGSPEAFSLDVGVSVVMIKLTQTHLLNPHEI